MRSGARPPWRELLPLTVLVLALHVLLLWPQPPRVAPVRTPPGSFAIRTIPPPAAAPPAAPAAAPLGPPPVTAPPAKPPVAKPAPAEPPPAEPPPAESPPAEPPPAAAAPVAPGAPGAPPGADPTPSAPPPPAAAAPVPQRPPSIEGATALPPPVLPIPEPARIHYEVLVQRGADSLAGRARLDWRHDGRAYEARLEAKTVGLPERVQRSTGRITEDGLLPGYFSDKGSRSEQATHFDRPNGRVVFSNNQPQVPIVEGMQDALSVLVQLSVLIAGEPTAFPPGTQFALPTATTREAATWVFGVEGEEDLELPGGIVRGLKLQRLPRGPYDQKVELWLAPRMDYAPVRLRLTNPNGDTVDHRWSSTDRG